MKPVKGLGATLTWAFAGVTVIATSAGALVAISEANPIALAAILLGGAVAIWVYLESGLFGEIVWIGIGHVAVFVRVQERDSKLVLDEGVWLIPPLSCVIQYDARERQLIIPELQLLSVDGVEISISVTASTRISNPYKYSDVVNPESVMIDEIRDAMRRRISAVTALEVGSSESISEDVLAFLKERSSCLGLSIVAISITNMGLPLEIQRFSQVVKIIRTQHPEISYGDVIDALQSNRMRFQKTVLESSSLQRVASEIANSLMAK